ncbi:hypothetical protein BJ980_002458 [Nocardioides daedukensis]|uniref:Uncharacterized protein n=1 Tax=Nocardioides daedukensis TaxID=634462 RepID=A0A7Y9UVX9_9ACTN|nr:hypothetical protein [Nocardioides daedukensis]NYG59535.1 hypothetical protein [Nocardioides daedukensis]
MPEPLQQSLAGLAQLIDARLPTGTALGNWRWTVRQRLAVIRDGLATETSNARDGWLVAREGSVLRERSALMTRLAALGPAVLESADLAGLRTELKRTINDVNHHLQRLRDLAYDEVELELGGSE